MDFTKNTISSLEYEVSTEQPQIIIANSDDLLSRPNFLIYCGLLSFGLIFNIIAMVTYCQKLKKSTYFFVFCLATCDIINILNVTLELFLHFKILPWIRELCIFQSFLADTGCLVSANLVVCVALNRYLLARHKNENISKRLCCYLVTGIVICSIIVTLPFLIASAFDFIYNSDQPHHTTLGRQYYDSSTEKSFQGLDQTSYFALTFYGVILTWLLSAFVVNIVLYIKMSYHLDKISNDRRKHTLLSVYSPRHLGFKFEEDIELAESCASSMDQLPKPCCTTGACRTVYDNNGNIEEMQPVRRTINELNRRKSSAVSLAHKSVTKTKKYIILVVLATTIFTFYFSHFALHVIHIIDTKVAQIYPNDNIYIHSIVEIVGHSYILCFIFNPVLYCFFNRRFFQNFRQAVLCCNKYKKQTGTCDSYQQKRLSQDSSLSSCL
ncbi:hypothetical protein ACF0H5_006330 [Mactra antiquata]